MGGEAVPLIDEEPLRLYPILYQIESEIRANSLAAR